MTESNAQPVPRESEAIERLRRAKAELAELEIRIAKEHLRAARRSAFIMGRLRERVALLLAPWLVKDSDRGEDS